MRGVNIHILFLLPLCFALTAAACGPVDPDLACPYPELVPGYGASNVPSVPEPSPFQPELHLVSSYGSPGAGLLPHASKASVLFVPGSTGKLCQLTGETDREFGRPTANRTETTAGVVGADLGFSFEHHGKLFFLFGDTVPIPGLVREDNEDSIAFTDPLRGNLNECVPLTYIRDPRDKGFHPPRIPGVGNGVFEVPAGGVSANDKMYVYFTNGHDDVNIMHRSVLGVSVDDGFSFSEVHEFSNFHFINVAPVKVNRADYPELPVREKTAILLFGSGRYRQSNPYLAVVGESDIEHLRNVWYFAGLDAFGNPVWSHFEVAAMPLFDQPSLGELSVAYNRFLGRFLMTYNGVGPAWINLRSSEKPWGSWSESQVIFDPFRDGGFCHYLHQAWKKQPKLDLSTVCDCISDPNAQSEGGAPYGPYLIPQLFTSDGTQTTIYYTLSLHNPYNTAIMKTTLRFDQLAE